jgi:hypothetical protein
MIVVIVLNVYKQLYFLINKKEMSQKTAPLVLELVQDGADKRFFFFSQRILSYHHDSNVSDQNLAGLIRNYLSTNIEGEIVIKNAPGTKELLYLFR